ncbi:PAQR family membrane homeostasis protein TrhA [Halioxenophilus sp. WMMB6]|uniref:PAQR family membrane homeostasis protein TrhA n=1 Tax=Halioxenophilus sp. WMMB6 TaxID=3073815 RepID=UPI00295F4E2B|nr:hemolysin III family protein [Halioxenophilus sp. WMMB6]
MTAAIVSALRSFFGKDRPRTIPEELVNSISHGLGALISISAVTFLIAMASIETDAWTIVAVSIYGGSLFLLFLASTLYHSIPFPKAKRVLQLFDHCAIYLLIAGTYTPFLLVSMRGFLGWAMFGLVWALAITGIVIKLVMPKRLHGLHVLNYVVMGWIGIITAPVLMAALSPMTLNLVLAGGIVYTVGVIFYALDRLPYAHSIWHLFVLGGSCCHFIAIYNDMI